MKDKMSGFAETIMHQKYSMHDGETWPEIAQRVTKNVFKAVGAKKSLIDQLTQYIIERKFLPGGRYLYASGRPFHQVNNCYGGETEFVTLSGTRTLAEMVGTTVTLMTSEGRWQKAPIMSFGHQSLRKVTLMRAGITKAIWATAGHSWRIATTVNKDTGRPQTKKECRTDCLKSGYRLWSVFGYGLSRTAPSLAGIQHGIIFGDGCVPQDAFGFSTAHVRLCGNKDAQLLKYFDGYDSYPVDDDTMVVGLPRHYKSSVPLQSDRAYLFGWLAGYFAADGCISETGAISISSTNKESLQLVKDVCYILGIGAYGISQSDRVSNLTNKPSRMYSVGLMRQHLIPSFFLVAEQRARFESNRAKKSEISWHVVSVGEEERLDEVFCAVVDGTNEFVLSDNILTGNCLLLRAEDSREGWAEHMRNCAMGLMTGAGIGCSYSLVRAEGKLIRKTGGFATGPLALMQMTNEEGRGIQQGGSRRSALWAGLKWNHADIMKFIVMKNWIPEVRAMKAKDFNFPATMDGTNISVQLDDDFFKKFEKGDAQAEQVYWATVKQMLKTGEPGFSVDCGKNSLEVLRNACTELTSCDDSDVCNLGSINLARIGSVEEFISVMECAVAFLLAGTVYSDVPYAKVDQVRSRNRRLGLGMMGLHEWLLVHGKPYGADDELDKYLEAYATSGILAAKYAAEWDLSTPIKTRSMAPNGTIGIMGETTTCLEPILCIAYKRRYLKGTIWNYQYVLDPTAKRLIEKGINPDNIEDAYMLSEDVERRLAFQAHVQKYVDHAISSTINLPPWGSEKNNESTVQAFGKMLIKYLPHLRGVTTYPDGARDGQPLTPVKWSTALAHVDKIFIEQADICSITGRGGSCGS